MGLWARYVLPFMVHHGCAQEPFREKRERLAPRATGRVLEVGLGSGHNLAHYRAGAVERVWGLDPSRPLLERAAAPARQAPFPVARIEAVAEAIPLTDGAADSAVVTWTLCSVDDPARVLAEMRRVLVPGGRLYFIEHGAAPDPRVRRRQERLTPLWRRVAGGCHLDRAVPDLLSAAGFALEELDAEYVEGPKIAAWTFWGVAVAPEPRPS